jgi:hypothetical protein
MPLLDKKELERLQACPIHECKDCNHAVRKNYCRQCDEFFTSGHAMHCPVVTKSPHNNHAGHRTY